MIALRIITLIILFMSLLFIILELATEQVEIFSPLAALTIIVGIILFFIIDPQEWLNLNDNQFQIVSAVIVAMGIIIVGLSVFLFLKVYELKNVPVEMGNPIGKKATVLTAISTDKPGYVLFEGGKWQAIPARNETFKPDQEVIITKVDGLVLYVVSHPELSRSSSGHKASRYCPMCGQVINEVATICPHCNTNLTNDK